MMDNKLSKNLYLVFHKLMEVLDVEDVKQERASLVVGNVKNLAIIWKYRHHMKKDCAKIVVEERLWNTGIVQHKKIKRKTILSNSYIPYGDSVTDDEDDLDPPCCKKCTEEYSFFVCWVIYPKPRLEVFCEHNINKLDLILNY